MMRNAPCASIVDCRSPCAHNRERLVREAGCLVLDKQTATTSSRQRKSAWTKRDRITRIPVGIREIDGGSQASRRAIAGAGGNRENRGSHTRLQELEKLANRLVAPAARPSREIVWM